MANNISYFADEALAVSSAAVAFTVATVGAATDALLVVETNPIRWLATGDAPTATNGTLAPVGAVITLDSPDQILSFKAIAIGADAVVSAQFGQ